MAISACCNPAPQCNPSYGFSYLGSCCSSNSANSAVITAYANDAAAGLAGVESGTLWKTSASNTLNLPAGVVLAKQ